MKFYHVTFVTIIIALLGVLTPLQAVSAEGEEDQFQDITTDVPQSVSEIYLPPNCPSSGHHPHTMFTILPSESAQDGVSIKTYPKDLVTARGGGSNTLKLEWNLDVASSADEGGVKIYMPADQLEAVSTAADAKVQILDGFTSIENLRVSSDSKLTAVMTQNLSTNLASPLTVKVSSDGEAQVITSGSCDRIEVSSDAKVSIEAASASSIRVSSDGVAEFKGNVEFADISSDGRLTIDGNLTDGGAISSDAKLTVYGQANGRIRISSDGKLIVRDDLLGDVDASSDAKVYAPNCNTVSTNSDAKCYVDDGISGDVNVDIEVLPFTLTGTDRCWFSSFSSMHGGFVALIVLAVLGLAGFCIWRRHSRRKCRDSQRAAPADFDVVYPAGTGGIPPPNMDDKNKAPQAEEDPSAVAYPVDHDPEKQHHQYHQDPNEQPPIKAEAIAVEPMEAPPSSSYDRKTDPAYNKV